MGEPREIRGSPRESTVAPMHATTEVALFGLKRFLNDGAP